MLTKEEKVEFRTKVRALKAQGMTYAEIGDMLGINRQTAMNHGRPDLTEHLCPECLQPLKPAKK